MTRAAAWLGRGLGALLFLHGLGEMLGSSPGAPQVVGTILGLAVFACASLAARGSGPAQLTLVGLALAVLAWHLPIYFGSYRVWPGLVYVGLASGTFGVGLLGFLIDRYPGPGRPGARL